MKELNEMQVDLDFIKSEFKKRMEDPSPVPRKEFKNPLVLRRKVYEYKIQ